MKPRLVHVLLVEDGGLADAAQRRYRLHFDRVYRGEDAFVHVTGCDVVVLDLGLTDVDGPEACHRLRECCSVPTIM